MIIVAKARIVAAAILFIIISPYENIIQIEGRAPAAAGDPRFVSGNVRTMAKTRSQPRR
jgi:hypothetical protein